jgi:hypothetical protein
MIQEAIKQEEERKKPQSNSRIFSSEMLFNSIIKNSVDGVMKLVKFGMKKISLLNLFLYVFYPVN